MSKSEPSSEVPKIKLGALERNRASLLKSAQECLIAEGPGVTIERFAELAGVVPTTIYKHFPSKNALFTEALKQLYSDFLVSGFKKIEEQTADPLGTFLWPAKLVFNVRSTHPELAIAILKSAESSEVQVLNILDFAKGHYEELVRNGILPEDKTEIRFTLFAYGGFGLLLEVLRNEWKSKDGYTDELVSLFGILGVSEAKARKIFQLPIQ